MPLVRIDLAKGKTPEHRKRIGDIVRIITLVDTYATLLEARDDRPPLSSARAFTALEHLEGKIDIALLHAFRPVAFGS